MKTLNKGKRKSWITEFVGVLNSGEVSLNACTQFEASQGKFNMYLNAGSRPRTTPGLVIPQPNYRTYVAHAGKTLPKTPQVPQGRFQSLKRGLERRGDSYGPPGIVSTGTSKVLQPKRMECNQDAASGSSIHAHDHVLSTINGNEGWRDCIGPWDMYKSKQPKASNSNKGYASKPYSRKQDLSPAATKKPKQIMLPKQEIAPKKLLREVNRSREYAKKYQVANALDRKDENQQGQCQVFRTERAGKQNLLRGCMGWNSDGSMITYQKNSQVKIYHQAVSNSRCCASSDSVLEGRGNLQHPLHQTAIKSSQRMQSRATYSEQISPARTAKLGGHQSRPSIVTPQLDLDGDKISRSEQRMQGRMLITSVRSQNRTFIPPPTAPGALGLLELRCQPQREKLSNAHSCKWADPKESPRIKGWKLGSCKADAIAKRIPGGEATQPTPEGLVVEVEGNKRGNPKATGPPADVERLHELLLLCDKKEANERLGHQTPRLHLSQSLEPMDEDMSIISSSEGNVSHSLKTEESASQEILKQEDLSNDRYENGFRLLAGKYEVLTVVGEGAYGLVMKCRILGAPEAFVAVKEFKLEEGDSDADEVKKTMHREVQILRELQHPHVVQTIEHFLVGEKVFIVMEFIPKNLLEVLEEQGNKGMERNSIRQVISQVVSAIAFIHQQGMVYRDIKPENILITKQGTVKLCDFGFARHVDKEEMLTDYVATRWYRAPELLLGQPFSVNGSKIQCPYGKPVDMWSIGCLMGELLDGEPLFAGDSDIDQLYKIQQILGPLVEEHNDIFRKNPSNHGIVFNIKTPVLLENRYSGKANAQELDFMQGLLQMNPHKRLTSQACMNHEYLQQHIDPVAIC